MIDNTYIFWYTGNPDRVTFVSIEYPPTVQQELDDMFQSTMCVDNKQLLIFLYTSQNMENVISISFPIFSF